MTDPDVMTGQGRSGDGPKRVRDQSPDPAALPALHARLAAIEELTVELAALAVGVRALLPPPAAGLDADAAALNARRIVSGHRPKPPSEIRRNRQRKADRDDSQAREPLTAADLLRRIYRGATGDGETLTVGGSLCSCVVTVGAPQPIPPRGLDDAPDLLECLGRARPVRGDTFRIHNPLAGACYLVRVGKVETPS